jgi:hypothetical protein
MDDASAIARSLKDPHAFAAVFDRHYAAVHALAGRRAGRQLADEIAQAGRPEHQAVPEGVGQELIEGLDALAPADREALLLYAWGELSP